MRLVSLVLFRVAPYFGSLASLPNKSMHSNNGKSFRPSGDLYRPNRHGAHRQGNYGPEGYNGRPDRGSSYPDRSSQRPDYRSCRGGGNIKTNRPHGSNYNGNQGLYRGNPQQSFSRQYSLNQSQGSNWLRTQQQRPQSDAYHLVYTQMLSESQVWMGDLDPRWSEADIASIWAELGDPPVNVKIMRDKTGRTQYCFLTFSNPELANAAVKRHKTPVPGSSRIFKLNRATGGQLGAELRQNQSQTHGGSGPRSQVDYSLFVGDLGSSVTEQMLHSRFNQQYPGAVKQVKIMTDANTGTSKGFGFVRFSTAEDQHAALKEMNGVVIGERAVRVGLANSSGPDQTTTNKSRLDSSTTTKLLQQQPPISPSTDPFNCVLSIEGIERAITREDLVSRFVPFGTLVYCRLDYKAHVAHIKFLLRTAAETAFTFMSGCSINGCNLSLRWGREEKDESTRMKTVPVLKSDKRYVASEKPPAFYGYPYLVDVLEDLTEEQLIQLKFVEPTNYYSMKEIDEIEELKRLQRDTYLEHAF